MAVLGVSGLFATETDDYDPSRFFAFYHDATACLVHNGRTLAAIEEERLNRDKHTNRFPINAIRACLDASGTDARDISHVAYFFEEAYTDQDIAREALDDPGMPLVPSRTLLHQRITEATGVDLSDRPTSFLTHHETHAASAFYDSGMSSALIVVSDGNGERDGICVFAGDGDGIRLLHAYNRSNSLGHFYTAVTKYVGYKNFDEYKVMGLASFGDRSVYRKLFSELYAFGPDGNYALANDRVVKTLIEEVGPPRRHDDPITRVHKDLAAAAQEAVERIGLHVIEHWLRRTGLTDLCLAGGVAQNTTLNGKLLKLPGVRRVFIPPSPHDAGAALGAAMIIDRRLHGRVHDVFSPTAYLGAPLGDDEHIRARLDAWGDFITYERPEHLERDVAAALAGGTVIGWTQGRAEFGPRALGNRSILADPRPAENRDRVNLMIKQREDYRPFAPVVTAPDAATYFELDGAEADHSYMGFVVPVREEHRAGLGAITHVDGTARVQALREEQNPRLYRLLKEFEAVAGVPVLLNTSFNNHAEPIVQSVDDAVTSFLTTGLDLLVVGPYVVQRTDTPAEALAKSRLEIPRFCQVVRTVDRHGENQVIIRTSRPNRRTPVSAVLAELLREGGRISDLPLAADEREELVREVRRLWDNRLVVVSPS
ncbi:carbamoyltransferase family protein [Saccharothrix australiensis]|uniref:Carbamoyltransferase/decarbamoylnovobiocin carbamoyltransferase/7-O-carbamoyltransferase n=1 Tax=Saccharothrix australiensis TaxID=2072 RepID=A0A495W7X5_9PSEU|nr:carbamoyltransferase C-terminal domain-containing protein [Saccharothrix australiensis]RKT57776.1 carbamoyltransferase/decarbamoylnovobiocin carbamoyltransferase/7-O-carbamoyltransferase [Saccharothrix australiensis]